VTGPPRIRYGAGRALEAGAIRAAAEAHPRLRRFMRIVAEHSEGGDRRAGALLEHIFRRIVDDVGDLHLGNATARLERIQVLRDNIASILDHVLEGGELPPNVRVETLGEYFDQLSTEMRELSRPREAIVGEAPFDLFDNSTEYAEGILRDFDRGGSGGGMHAEPIAALTDALHGLPPEQQAALRHAASLERGALWRAITSETQTGQLAAMADLTNALGSRVNSGELADLRTAIETLGRARSRSHAHQMSPTRLAEALARIHDTDLRAVVEASGDVWIVQQLAAQNPEQLAAMWDSFRRTSGRTDFSAGAFRRYLRHEMVTFGRAVPGEYTAAFALGSIEMFLKGPDVNVRAGGTDLVGIGHDGWTYLIDDKSHRAPSVDDVTSLNEFLVPNLRDDAARIERTVADLRAREPDIPIDQRVVDSASRMRAAADEIAAIPQAAPNRAARIRAVLDSHRIRLRITSAMGEVVDITQALRDLGIGVEGTGLQPRLPRPGRR
jgi:hypothetical protein